MQISPHFRQNARVLHSNLKLPNTKQGNETEVVEELKGANSVQQRHKNFFDYYEADFVTSFQANHWSNAHEYVTRSFQDIGSNFCFLFDFL